MARAADDSRHTSLFSDAAETMHKNSDVAETIRRTAYFLWDHDGRLEGRSLDYWLRAKDMHQRWMAYDIWLAEGTPVGRADWHWHGAAGRIEGE